MTATTTAVIAATTSSNIAAMNAARERRERVEQCNKFVNGYTNDKATVEEARQYASCVQLLHPAPSPDGPPLGAKVAVGSVFLFVIAGAILGWRDSRGEGAFMFAFLGLVAWFVSALVLAGLVVLVA